MKYKFESDIPISQIFEDIRNDQKEKDISEFLKSWDYMMERIEFHTENPDSELMDEVIEEYNKYEERLKE